MSKPDWAMLLIEGSKYLTHDSWGIEVISRKDAEKLLRAERARARQVVRAKQRSLHLKTPSQFNAGYSTACDDILRGLK